MWEWWWWGDHQNFKIKTVGKIKKEKEIKKWEKWKKRMKIYWWDKDSTICCFRPYTTAIRQCRLDPPRPHPLLLLQSYFIYASHTYTWLPHVILSPSFSPHFLSSITIVFFFPDLLQKKKNQPRIWFVLICFLNVRLKRRWWWWWNITYII